MAKLDAFTLKRIAKFARDFRESNAQLPTLNDFEKNGIDPATVDAAVKAGTLTQLYVTLTSGAIVKGYKAN